MKANNTIIEYNDAILIIETEIVSFRGKSEQEQQSIKGMKYQNCLDELLGELIKARMERIEQMAGYYIKNHMDV